VCVLRRVPQASYVEEQQLVAQKVDLVTGELLMGPQPFHRFRVRFEAPTVRQAATLKAMEIAARVTEAARLGAAAAGEGGAAHAAAGMKGEMLAARAATAGVHAPITESFIPPHLDHEKRQQGLSGSSSSEEQYVMTNMRRCTRSDVVCSDWEEVRVAVPA
jgi:hypothetical protein